MRRILTDAAVAVAAVVSWGMPAFAQETREFRDWAVICDAAAACIADTPNINGSAGDFALRLTRTKSEPTWNIMLVTNAARPNMPPEIYADLDGASVAFQGEGAAGAFGRPTDIHLLGPNATDLMARMAPASDVGFEFLEASGDLHDPRFSLSGLSASLLWIDEKQERIGAPREAGNPPQGLSLVDVNAPVVPATPAVLPEEVLIVHGRQDDCEAAEDLPNGDEFIVAELSGERTMYFVPCYAGAYNFAHAAYTMSGSYVERSWFADYNDYSTWTATNVLVNPYWDAATGTLSMFNRGRGIGDCGSTGEWRAVDGYLRMQRFTYKGECDAEGEPDDFPVIFEAPPVEQ